MADVIDFKAFLSGYFFVDFFYKIVKLEEKRLKQRSFSMDIVLFGYGKMGNFLYKILDRDPLVDQIYIVDPFPKNPIPSKAVWVKNFEEIKDKPLEAAFIASNSITHADVLKQVLQAGIHNVFCEKPMCLTQDEYKIISDFSTPQTKIVVDYILRSSPAVMKTKKILDEKIEEGFKLKCCNIHYGKDKTKDPRRFRDVGVYEELYHPWDLCFNGILFGSIKKIDTLRNIYTPDPEIENRCLAQRFNYLVTKENGEKFFLNLRSSFGQSYQQRSFIFFLYRGKEKCIVSLIFDQNKEDKCLVVHPDNTTEYLTFNAHDKLDRQVHDSLRYFKQEAKAPYLHEASHSLRLHTLLEKMNQTKPMVTSALRECVAQNRSR